MSFRVRVFVLVVLVALSAIGATAWLTFTLIQRALENPLPAEDRNAIVEELAEYGRAHGTWVGVTQILHEHDIRGGRRLRLVATDTLKVIADSDQLAGRPERPITPTGLLVDPRPPIGAAALQRPGDALPGLRPFPGVPAKFIAPDIAASLPAEAVFFDRVASGEPGLRAAREMLRQLLQYRAALRAVACFEPGLEYPPLATLKAPFLTAAQIGADPDCVEAAAAEVAGDTTRRRADQQALDRCLLVLGREVAEAPAREKYNVCLEGAFAQRISDTAAPQLQVFFGQQSALPFSIVREPAALGLSGLAVIAVLGTALVARGVYRPVHRLTVASLRLARGDLDVRVPAEGSGDLATLSQSFNRMADAVQRSEERQRRLVADVAHELRTPLSNLRGYLEGLQDGVVEPSRELFGSLLEETTLQRRILDDLQVLALAEAGNLQYARSPIDLAELARHGGTVHRAVAAEAGVELTVETPAEVWVNADPDRLRQVLGNLLTNAIRHTPRGGSVTVRTTDEDGTAVLAVADTGAGISPADLPRVFDRFWRADPTRQRATGGSGLGLTIAHRIVTDHGGTIAVTSVVGAGATFTVRLPPGPPPAPSRR